MKNRAASMVGRGFTLIELMVVLAVMGVLIALGAPSLTEFIVQNRLVGQTNEFVTTLTLARSEAIKRGTPVLVARTGTDWEDGWRIYADANQDNAFDTDDGDEELQIYPALAGGNTLRVNANYTAWVRFDSFGAAAGNAGTGLATFRVCRSDRSTEKGRAVALISTGRVSTSAGVSSCP